MFFHEKLQETLKAISKGSKFPYTSKAWNSNQFDALSIFTFELPFIESSQAVLAIVNKNLIV